MGSNPGAFNLAALLVTLVVIASPFIINLYLRLCERRPNEEKHEFSQQFGKKKDNK